MGCDGPMRQRTPAGETRAVAACGECGESLMRLDWNNAPGMRIIPTNHADRDEPSPQPRAIRLNARISTRDRKS